MFDFLSRLVDVGFVFVIGIDVVEAFVDRAAGR